MEFMAISIFPVTRVEECRLIEQLQLEIWGGDGLEVTPDHLLLTMAKEGGVVLLATTDSGQPVGFGYGFLAMTDSGRLKLASHQVGVLPAYQNTGLGFKLKLAQRAAALARQLDLITWTFDPLQSRNARLNLRKLGAVSQTYLCNLYGDMRDELNQGLPTDRFRVDWWLTSTHVVDRLAGRSPEVWPSASECPLLNPATILDNGLALPADIFDWPTRASCLVEIPAELAQLKSQAPELAFKWRWQTRQLFEAAFASGYTAVDLLRREGRSYYLLQKDWQPSGT
jgi:predicted GNAT superfamily acetyltransferase